MRGAARRTSVGGMDRIVLTVLLVGGYLALVVAANVDEPDPAPAAAVAAAPASADAVERWYDAVAPDGAAASQTADAAERSLTAAFDRLPKPHASR